ncbi:Uncharacterised protein [Mycobacteroides abscessus subsp. abscessus]|nr:Uncharacterised protein [Mycobacteroides abscessus subsp. abscessus]
MSMRVRKNATNQTLDGPAFTLTGVRLTVVALNADFLRTLDLGIDYLGSISDMAARRVIVAAE